jgi:hypothetical protein
MVPLTLVVFAGFALYAAFAWAGGERWSRFTPELGRFVFVKGAPLVVRMGALASFILAMTLLTLTTMLVLESRGELLVVAFVSLPLVGVLCRSAISLLMRDRLGTARVRHTLWASAATLFILFGTIVALPSQLDIVLLMAGLAMLLACNAILLKIACTAFEDARADWAYPLANWAVRLNNNPDLDVTRVYA